MTPPATTTFRQLARATAVVTALAASLLAACRGDGPVGIDGIDGPRGTPGVGESVPATTVPADTATDVGVDMLLWDAPVDADETVSATIGPEGGVLEIGGPSTLKLIVPRHAVERAMRFSVTRRAGRIVAYDFGPHGATFAVPLRLEHETRGTNFRSLPHNAVVQAVYYQNPSLLDQARGTAVAHELLETGLTATKDKVLFRTGHFSGYGISTGRNGSRGTPGSTDGTGSADQP